MNPPDTCPHCTASMKGSLIPEEFRSFYGGHTHFNDMIAITFDDEVKAWECPDCHSRFDARTMIRKGTTHD